MILAVLAYLCDGLQNLLWFAFSINGVTAGSLLGIFLLGLLTQRKSNVANTLAMVASSATMAVLLVLIDYYKVLNLGWSWLLVIGTVSTFALAWLLGPLLDNSKHSVSDAPAQAPTPLPAGS